MAAGIVAVTHLLATAALFGQSGPLQNIRFDHLTVEDGLSQSFVAAIEQDKYGFMWFSTKDGLNRYDGYKFTLFRHDPADSTSLPEQFASPLYKDRDGELWIGGHGGVVARFSPVTQTFQRFALSRYVPAIASYPRQQSRVGPITRDLAGGVWIKLSNGELYRMQLDADGNQITHVSVIYSARDSTGLSRDVVRSVLSDASGTVWVTTKRGLDRLVLSTEWQQTVSGGRENAVRPDALTEREAGMPVRRLARYAHAPGDPQTLLSNSIRAMKEDGSGNLWLVTNHGLSRFDRTRETFLNFPFGPNVPPQFGSGISEITEDHGRNIWIAGLDGLVIFSPSDRIYRYVRHDPSDPFSLSAGHFLAIYCDDGGVVWAGSNGYGISKYAPYAQRFELYGAKPDGKMWLGRTMSVRSIYETSDGKGRTLWIGSYNGFYRYDRTRDQWQDLQLHPDLSAVTTPGQKLLVLTMTQDRSGTLWIGSTEGLFQYDSQHDKFRHYRHNPTNPHSLRFDKIMAVYEDRDGRIWVVTPGTLSLFNRESEQFVHYVYDLELSRHPHGVSPSGIVQDRQKRFWLGSRRNGLIRFEPDKNSVRFYKPDPTNPHSLNSNTVNTILEDPRQPERILWVGTGDGGLNRFDMTTEQFTHYTETDGLSNNVVYGILADDDGNLWMSTNQGINKFNPKTETFRQFDISNGLQSNEFNAGAYYKSPAPRGEMFFGGIHGFNAFYPRKNPTTARVTLTDLKLFGKSVARKDSKFRLRKPIYETKEIELSHRDKMLSLEFAALDYTDPTKNEYAYKMENFNEDWIYSGKLRTAHYTNLDPGEYVFRVKSSSSDGVWTEEGVALRIRITPPPWRTWWAYTLYFLSALGTLYGIRRYELNRIRLKNQVKLQHLEAEKLKEVDQLKSRFFANISHEFRTPLTLILGPLQSLRAGTFKGDVDQQYGLMQRSAHRLLRLINQLLDLSKLEAGGMALRATRGDLIPFVKGLIFSFESVAKQKGITLSFQSDYDRLETWFEAEKLEHVITNLIANAVKFTPANSGGRITVTVTKSQLSLLERLPPNTECVQIVFQDTGIGIPAEALPLVFNRFYQVGEEATASYKAHAGTEGTGIGLALAKEIVELHYGEIHVESEAGRGTQFTVTLPLGRAHLQPNEIASDETAEPPSSEPQAFLPHPEAELAEAVSSGGEETPAAVREADQEEREIILIVEDHRDLRAFIRQHLEPAYQILEAVDGADGVDKAIARIPDLIISDVMMPEMDGFALCEKLKEDEKTSHVPIILLTAKASAEAKIAGLETGADDYLTKPFDSKELQVRVRNLIEQRRKLRQRFSREVVLKPAEIAITSVDEAFLHRVKAAVEAHLGEEEFSVEELAREVAMSRMQLHRKLRALTDQSAGQFILSMRLERAVDLMRQDAGTIAEIAYMTGFNTPNYFAKCFRRQFGCSPSEYKRSFTSDS